MTARERWNAAAPISPLPSLNRVCSSCPQEQEPLTQTCSMHLLQLRTSQEELLKKIDAITGAGGACGCLCELCCLAGSSWTVGARPGCLP